MSVPSSFASCFGQFTLLGQPPLALCLPDMSLIVPCHPAPLQTNMRQTRTPSWEPRLSATLHKLHIRPLHVLQPSGPFRAHSPRFVISLSLCISVSLRSRSRCSTTTPPHPPALPPPRSLFPTSSRIVTSRSVTAVTVSKPPSNANGGYSAAVTSVRRREMPSMVSRLASSRQCAIPTPRTLNFACAVIS